MPHALYLGSHLATQDRVSSFSEPVGLPAPASNGQRSYMRMMRRLFAVGRTTNHDERDVTTPYGDRENNSQSFIKAHLTHGIIDIVVCLLGFAVAINSAFVL